AKAREAFLFDTASGKELGQIELEVEVTPLHRGPIRFSPDGKLLAVGLASTPNGKERVALYEVPSGKLLHTLGADPAAPPGKAKGKGGRKGAGGAPAAGAAIGGAPAAGAVIAGGPGGAKGPGFRSASTQKLLFSPDGKALAVQSASDSTMVLLDTATGKKI